MKFQMNDLFNIAVISYKNHCREENSSSYQKKKIPPEV